MFKFEMGTEVKDRITGVSGVVVCRTQYITGCNRYSIQPLKLTKDGRPQDWLNFDEDSLIETKKKKVEPKRSEKGGMPQHEALQIR